MKIVKKILLGVLAVVVILLIIGLLMKKDYHVEREVVINKPASAVFNYIKFLKNQANYSVWAKMDPNAEMKFNGVDGTVGFISAWDSKVKNVGAGEQEIKAIKFNERIDYELRFKRPFSCTDKAYMITDSISVTQTKVKWGVDGKMHYPMNIMLPMMNMNKMLGSDLQSNLNNLKILLEK